MAVYADVGQLRPELVVPDLKSFTPVKNSFIELDKGLGLADSPMSYHKHWKAEGKSKETLTTLMLGYVRRYWTKNKFQEAKYRKAVNNVLAVALYASGHNKPVLYSRSTHKVQEEHNPENISNSMIINVVDALSNYGFLSGRKGKPNEYQKVKSWFEVTDKLKTILANAELLIITSKKSPLIVLRDAKKEPLRISTNKQVQNHVSKLKRPVERFNAFWLEHEVTLSGAPVVPFLHRVFNINLTWGGRFYGEYQTIRKALRSLILIDGEPTIELDYSCLHINLLYAEAGIQFIGDAYKVIGCLHSSLSDDKNRDLLKAFMLRLVNAGNLKAFCANVTKSGNPDVKRAYAEYVKLKPYLTDKERKKRYPQLEGFIEGVPDGLTGEQVLELIKTAHAPIAHRFGEERIGSKLQFKDSQIMANALTNLIDMKVPGLPIHDSIICRKRDEFLVMQALKDAYSEHTGGYTVAIKQEKTCTL